MGKHLSKDDLMEDDDDDDGDKSLVMMEAGFKDLDEPAASQSQSAFAVAEAKAGAWSSGVTKKQSVPSSKEGRSAGPKLARISSTRSLGGPASSAGDNDKESTVGGDLPGDPAFDQLPEHLQLQQLLTKLDINKILQGKKLGRQVRNAGFHVPKLSSHHGAILETHLQSCRWAEVLAPHNLGTSKESAIQEAVAGLRDHVTEWPSQLILSCWNKTKKHLVERAVSSADEKPVMELLEQSRPWCLVGEMSAKMDLLHPTVRCMEGKSTTLVRHFSDALLEVVCQLVKKGEGASNRLVSVVQCILTWLASALENDELDDAYVRCLVEVKESLKADMAPLWQGVSERGLTEEAVLGLFLRRA